MYALYAERRGWNMELVYENTTELGGVKEASATIEGQGAWSRLKFEAGPTGSSGCRKPSPPAASRPPPPPWP